MPRGRIQAENQYQERWQKQRERGKAVASEIAELFAKNRRHNGGEQTQMIAPIVFCCDWAGGRKRRRPSFAELFPTVLRGKPVPQESAQQNHVQEKEREIQ